MNDLRRSGLGPHHRNKVHCGSGVNAGRLQLHAKVGNRRLALESGDTKLDELALALPANKLLEQLKRLLHVVTLAAWERKKHLRVGAKRQPKSNAIIHIDYLAAALIVHERDLLIATGMRRGEMLGLMWGFVDLDGERLFIAHQYDTDKNLREPKTEKSKRWVSIKGRMADVLRAWKAQQAGELAAIGLPQTDETPVFANELGQFIDPNNYARWWRNFSVDNGFGVFTKDVRTSRMNGKEVTRGKGYEGLKLHELRHTQATLIQGAVSPKAAQHRLGHSQISMTMNTYAHALDTDEIAAAEAMDRILGQKK